MHVTSAAAQKTPTGRETRYKPEAKKTLYATSQKPRNFRAGQNEGPKGHAHDNQLLMKAAKA